MVFFFCVGVIVLLGKSYKLLYIDIYKFFRYLFIKFEKRYNTNNNCDKSVKKGSLDNLGNIIFEEISRFVYNDIVSPIL